MNLRKSVRLSCTVITACTIIPLFVSETCERIPEISDKCLGAIEKIIRISQDVRGNNPEPAYSAVSAVNKGSAWDMEAAPDEIETPLSQGEEIPTPLPSQEVIDALPYPTDLTDEDGQIQKTNFGVYSGDQYFDLTDGGQVRNLTSISNDELLSNSTNGRSFEIDLYTDEPQVIIYHTHTTETYELYDKTTYDSDFNAKTTEPDKNMTAVGDAICEQLEACGITVIHDTLVHDYPSYNGAYESSRETVSELLEEYPSVKIALDIHRDGIETSDGVRLQPVAEIDGKEAAQIMIISGCDDGTMNMPDYMKNFAFACELQSQLETMYSGLTRPVLFDYRFYNQDLTTGSLLIEVGSHGNTLDQAVYSGELIGKALAGMFTDGGLPTTG